MTTTVTDEFHNYAIEQLIHEINTKYDGPTIEEQLGVLDGDAHRRLFFETPFDEKYCTIDREIFRILQDNSSHRSYHEVNQKFQDLLVEADTREEGIAMDILQWVLNEETDWVLDEWIEESKGLSDTDD